MNGKCCISRYLEGKEGRMEERKGRLEEIEATYVCFISVSLASLSPSSVEPIVPSTSLTLYFQKAPSSP